METVKMLKCMFPCGDLLYFNYNSETMDVDASDNVYFKEPFFRCPNCTFDSIKEEEREGEMWRLCPAKVSIVDMSDEDIKRELIQVSGEEGEEEVVEETD